jgi:hypothetical protein
VLLVRAKVFLEPGQALLQRVLVLLDQARALFQRVPVLLEQAQAPLHRVQPEGPEHPQQERGPPQGRCSEPG